MLIRAKHELKNVIGHLKDKLEKQTKTAGWTVALASKITDHLMSDSATQILTQKPVCSKVLHNISNQHHVGFVPLPVAVDDDG